MKKVLISIFWVLTLSGYAQKFNVETAAIAVKHYEDATSNADDKRAAIEEGKGAIDKAYTNAESQLDAKMWYLRGKIYTYIATDTLLKAMMDTKSADVAKEALINCIQKDNDKKKYSNEARSLLCAAIGVVLANKAVEHYNNANYEGAIASYKSLLDIYPYDTGKLLEKSNLSEGTAYYYLGSTCYQASLKKDAIMYTQKAIDKNYMDPKAYVFISGVYLELGDTVQALQAVETGRERFSQEPKLIEAEINLYIAMQKVEVLVKKLDAAIEANPDKEVYYYVRGNSYQSLARSEAQNIKKQDSILSNLNKQIKSTADPKKKATLQTKANEHKAKLDQSKANYSQYSANCAKDYKKALELNDGMFDAHYCLAAYYLDMAAPYTEILNDPNASVETYEKAEQAQAEYYKSAIASFEAGLSVLKGEPKTRLDILYQMFKLYARINDPEKAKEYKNKYEEFKQKYEAGELSK